MGTGYGKTPISDCNLVRVETYVELSNVWKRSKDVNSFIVYNMR